MKQKIIYGVIIIVAATTLCAAIFAMAQPSQKDRTLGRFEEIRHDDYTAPNGSHIREYLVYDKQTKLVYIYSIAHDCFSITPYMMRDSYGMITVGIYDLDTCVIKPAEPDYSDEVELVVLG